VFRFRSLSIMVAPASDNMRSSVLIVTAHTNRGIHSMFMLIVAINIIF
jgi:hypothetical protein